MSREELRHIEVTLGITLPEPYKRLINPFPVPFLRGNADTELWDDANQLIARNQELRTEFVRGHRPWPQCWYFIGDPLTACGNAMDIRLPEASVHWVDHCDLQSLASDSGQPFEKWLHAWVTVSRADLEKDGIDPDSDPG